MSMTSIKSFYYTHTVTFYKDFLILFGVTQCTVLYTKVYIMYTILIINMNASNLKGNECKEQYLNLES
jgi:hypothetical protein